jgi:hypothetical protein
MRGEWAAESLRMLGICGWLAGDFERAQRHWQEAAEMARRLGAKCTLAQVHLERGRLMQSDTGLVRAAELFSECGFPKRMDDLS